MSEHDPFAWPPPSSELEAIEVLDLDTGRPVRVSSTALPSTESSSLNRLAAAATRASDPATRDRTAPSLPPDFTWPPIDPVDAAPMTVDADSPWATTSAAGEAGWSSWSSRDSASRGPVEWSDDVRPLASDLPVRAFVPVWARYAAAVLVCAGAGVIVAPWLRHDPATRSAMVRVHAGDDADLPRSAYRNPPDRAGSARSDAASYPYADLRLPRGLGDDRAGPPSFAARGDGADALTRRGTAPIEPVASNPVPSTANPSHAASVQAPPTGAVVTHAALTTAAPALTPASAIVPPASPAPMLSASAPLDDSGPALALPTAVATPAEPAIDTAATRLARDTGDRARIEATLDRYRTAYASLDAAAARSVWPTVDQRALERAFGSLKSQGLDFDGCTTDLQGTNATVACRGRATYVPRIGSQRPRTEAHRWRFKLRKVDESWMIVNAEAS